MIDSLVAVMLLALSFEVPGEINKEHQEDVGRLAWIYWDVGRKGAIVNPTVDPYLLAAVGYYESRWRRWPKDGDCYYDMRKPGKPKLRCTAIGPHQLSTSSPIWLKTIHSRWIGVTVKGLREPITNVQASYDMLVFWKKVCKGSPGVTLEAYGRGKCPKSKRPAMEGRRRCALATAMARRNGVEFKCGHEKLGGLGKRTRGLIRRLR